MVVVILEVCVLRERKMRPRSEDMCCDVVNELRIAKLMDGRSRAL